MKPQTFFWRSSVFTCLIFIECIALWNFITWINSRNQHHNQDTELSQHRKLPGPLSSHPSLSPNLWQPLMVLYHYNFILRRSYKGNHTVCNLLRLFLFSNITLLPISPRCHMYPQVFFFIPLYGWTHTLYSFACWRTFGLSPVWAIIMKTLMNIHEQVFLDIRFHLSAIHIRKWACWVLRQGVCLN